MKRQEKIQIALKNYMQARKVMFQLLKSGAEKSTVEPINNLKKQHFEELLTYLHAREFDSVVENFQKIIKDGVPGCDMRTMQTMLESGNSNYNLCIDKQELAISNMLEANYVTTQVIIDAGDNVILCNSDYFYHGQCHI